jgi:RHS repeat-associated protein
MRTIRISLLLSLLLLFASSVRMAQAQDDPNFENGLKSFGSYHAGNIDHIDLSNGALNVDIPLISYPQVGGKLKLDFVLQYHNSGNYDDCVYDQNGNCSSYSGEPELDHGWNVMEDGAPFAMVLCGDILDYTNYDFSCTGSVYSSDGGVHQIFPESNMTTWRPFDSSGLQVTLSGLPNWQDTYTETVTDSSGVTYSGNGCLVSAFNFGGYNQNTGNNYYSGMGADVVPGLRQDANGNRITCSSSTGWTDTMGRVIPQAVPANPSDAPACPTGPLPVSSAFLWTPPGLEGGTYPIKFCLGTMTETSNFGWTPSSYTAYPLQTVILPNGTMWSFQYTSDGNADLSQITFPIGGTLSYTWLGYEGSGGPNCDPHGVPCPGHDFVDVRSVATRTLNPNDGSTPATWSYSGYQIGIGNQCCGGPPYPVTVTDPAGNDTVHTFSNEGSVPFFETQTQSYQGTGSNRALLKTSTTAYSYSLFEPYDSTYYESSVSPSQTTTLWANGQENEVAYVYDTTALKIYDSEFIATGGDNGWQHPNATGFSQYAQFTNTAVTYGLLLSKKEFDYGSVGSNTPGARLRTTTTSYQALNNSSYLNNNLLNLPASVQVVDGGGTQRAYTTYAYDESPSPSGAHGNPTSVHRWLNTTGGYLVSSKVYDSNGRITSSTDPCGNTSCADMSGSNHTTTYGYSPSSCPPGSGYAGSAPTSVTNPLLQTTSSCYDLNTGLPIQTTDLNSQTTYYQYDDMLRTTQITYPVQTLVDGQSLHGVTLFTYPEATQVQISELMDDQGHSKISNLLVDGLGREIQRNTTNGEPVPYDQEDTCYDGLGRVSFKSYPYQSSGLPSTRSCSGAGDAFAYDALSRTITVTHSDGSTVLTFYAGRATSISDEGNGAQRVQRISQVDGLGRLISVCEVFSASLTFGISGSTAPAACGQDISATGFLTTYTYDALNDLLSITQGPLNARTFQYDSFSRLTSTTNPETGTITSTYDANDNEITDTDARNITTTTTYDALNRLTGKTYSDGTPRATFVYDTCPSGGCPSGYPSSPNTVGRLVESSNSNARTFDSYDPTGRVKNEWQCTPQNCGTGYFPLAYTYDLLDDITMLTNGMGVIFGYQYNLGARLTYLTSSLNDANHPATLLGYQAPVHYNAAGSIISAPLGNGITETRAYDPRLRLCGITDGSVYSVAIPSNIQNQCPQGSTNGLAPNGDILAANDTVNGNWTYAYDAFNRLTGSSQNGGATAYSYAYDRFGNRWYQNVTAGSGPSPSYGFDANNHIVSGSGVSYDAAGNVINDGIHAYAYDAENRLTQVDGGATASYAYDADGSRVRKTANGVTTDYIYDLDDNYIAQVNGSGNWTVAEIYADGKHLATYSGGSSGTTYFIHPDWLGTERARSTTTGAPYETCTSLPFGDGLNCTGGDPSPLHFTGKERDPESGLDNFLARYDASSTGRFMSPDNPGDGWDIGNPQSLNLYAYVQDNPINDVDPTGHMGALAGQCFTAAPQKQVASGCPGGASVFDTNLDCTLDPACGQFWGTSAISGAEFGDPQGVKETNNVETQKVAKAGDTQAPLPLMPNVIRSETRLKLPSLPSCTTDPSCYPVNRAAVFQGHTTTTQAGQPPSIMQNRGRQGGQGKGEKGQTSKPDKPRKGTKQDEHGRWWSWNKHKGNWILKPPGWTPDNQKKAVAVAEAGATAGFLQGVIETAPEWLPFVFVF